MNYPTSYKGGLNYFRNLFYAIDTYLKKDIEIVLFVPDDLSQEYVDIFSGFARIEKTAVLKRNSGKWLIDKIFEKTINVNPLLNRLLLKHKIDIVSHSSFISKKVKTINWIMDFQHIHFPDLWTDNEMKATRKFLHRLIVKSDGVFLSSFSAFEDFKTEYKEYTDKVTILHFVSQPVSDLKVELDKDNKAALEQKYAIDRPFFYLPNQFWSHKNHAVVFKAINNLKQEGYEPLLVTSGLMNDFRSKSGHIQDLKDFVQENNLKKNILFLGLIPYADVLDLLTLSKCVINPSRFEGWSSTVEEAKTMGKRLVLSSIAVHKEQKPEYGVYFDATDDRELTAILKNVIDESLEINNDGLKHLQSDLDFRTKVFADKYLAGIKRVLQIN